MGPSRSITVLGGGLSGLSAAFHLSRRFPPHTGTRITLVEKSDRLGGWVKSERVRVEDQHGHRAQVLLESGPRTLRPASKAILELIHLLNLSPSVLTVPRSAPAARNRFLHIPGSKGLLTIPGSLPSLLVSPLAKILVPAVLRDFRLTQRIVLNDSSPDNESVDAFLTRHFSPDFAQTLGSALVHGIYAADSRLLSVRAAFPALCRLEENGRGSVVRGALKEMLSSSRRTRHREDLVEPSPYDLGDVPRLMKGVSVYSFRDGMQTLTDAMARHIRLQQNVDIAEGDAAISLLRTNGTDGDRFQITTRSGRKMLSTHVVSALPLPLLHKLLASSHVPEVTSSASPPPISRPRFASARHTTSSPPPPFPHPALSVRSGIAGRYEAADPDRPTEAAAITSLQPPGSATLSSLPPLPHVLANPSSSVTVVNLVFPPSDVPIHPDGFGYLVPRPRPDYPSPKGSSLGVLGMVFDSSALGGQDTYISADYRSRKFTKVTVMLGGPYGAPSPGPDSPEFLPALLATLQQHLGHAEPLPEPCLVRIRQHHDCIPTPTPGHVRRMEELRAAIREQWGDSAAVIGAGVGGVSVGDCIESGRRVAFELD